MKDQYSRYVRYDEDMIYLHGEVHYPRFTHQTQFLLSYVLICKLIFLHDSGDLHQQLPPDHSKKLCEEQFRFFDFLSHYGFSASAR